VFLGFPTINRWGQRGSEKSSLPAIPEGDSAALQRRGHVLWKSRTMYLLTEMINNRLFSIVREKQGLLYTASIYAQLPDLYDRGTVIINLTPFTESIALTVEETIKVLLDFRDKKFTMEEFMEAKVPYVANLRSDLFQNSFWLTHLECMQLPHCVSDSVKMDFSCCHSFPERYDEITLEDVHIVTDEYFRELDKICASVGVAGKAPPSDIAAQVERITACLARTKRE